MPWLARVVVRRLSVQVPVLAGVTALAVAACTLLGSVAVLLSSLDGPVTGALLTEADPQDTALRVTLRPDHDVPDDDASDREAADASADDPSGDEVSAADPSAADVPARAATQRAVRALGTVAGDVPLSATVWYTTGIHRLGPGRHAPGSYFTAFDELPVNLVEGTLPVPGTSGQRAGAGPSVPVAVPLVLAHARDWTVGDEATLHPAGGGDTVGIEVTGVYEPTRPFDTWASDRLAGAGHDPEFFLSTGAVWTELYGPLLTSPEALHAAGVPVSEVHVSAAPDLADLTAAGAAALTERTAAGGPLLAQEVGPVADVEFGTRLDHVVDSTRSRVGAARAVVLMAGLVLLVVAGAALRLVARFLAEQRSAGLELLHARGASRAQLVRLAVVEAAGIATVVTLVSPWLATRLVEAVTTRIAHAGPPADSGSGVAAGWADPADPVLWAACALASVVLAALLVVPVLRADPAASDDGVPATRPGRTAALRQALFRSGGTVVLAALAGIAVWQLAAYRTPAAGGGTDPVVVVAPALLLLATALVTARLLPVLARVTDRLAARSRHLTFPLAAWETGRRPARAAGTVLLLTLSTAVVVAAPSTLATWRTSQLDQADLAVGAPARLTDVSGTALEASARVADASGGTGVSLQPVTHRSAPLVGEHGRGRSVRVLALDDPGPLRGRVVDGGASAGGPARTWDDVAAPLGPSRSVPGESSGIEIPAGTVRLDARTDVSAEVAVDPRRAAMGWEFRGPIDASETREITGELRVDLLLRDAHGVREQRTFTSRQFPPGEGVAGVELRPDGTPIDEPLRLVGMTATIRQAETGSLPAGAIVARVHLGLSDLRVTDESGTVSPVDLGPWHARSIPVVAGEPGEESFLPQPGPLPAPTDGASLTVAQELHAETFFLFGTRFAMAPRPSPATPFPGTADGDAVTPLPAVVTTGLLDQERVEIGDLLRLDGPAPLTLQVAGAVRHLPGGTGEGVLVRRDALQAAQFASGSPLDAPDEWWGEVSDADVVPLRAALDGTGALRTLAEERAAALSGPLPRAIPTALVLLAAAAVLLAGAGVAAGATSGLRLRRLEVARLLAAGVPRRLLVRSALVEHGLLAGAGALGGVIAGTGLLLVLAPATAVGPDGGPPVPGAVTVVPWDWLLPLGAITAAVVGLAVAVSVNGQIRQASAQLLRLGGDR